MLTWLNKARRVNKSAIEPRLFLNNYYLSIGKFQEALVISNELVDIQPENIKILKSHADNLLKANKTSQAIRIFKKIVDLKPDSALPYFWLASAQYIWNDIENARVNFSKVLTLKPNHIISRNAIIKIDLRNKHYGKALFQATELVKSNPKVALSHETMGDIYMYLRKPEKAIDAYKTALFLKEKNFLVVTKIARAYAVTNNFKMAEQTLETWLKSYPKNIKVRMMLAVLYQQKQQLEKAKKHYEIVIELAPDNVSAINNLALIYSSLDDPRTYEYAEIAYSLAPEDPNVLDTLGWLLLKNGEQKRALKLLKQGVEINPSDFDLRYHYAVALSENNYIKEAKIQLNMIIPIPGKFSARKEATVLLKNLNKNTP